MVPALRPYFASSCGLIAIPHGTPRWFWGVKLLERVSIMRGTIGRPFSCLLTGRQRSILISPLICVWRLRSSETCDRQNPIQILIPRKSGELHLKITNPSQIKHPVVSLFFAHPSPQKGLAESICLRDAEAVQFCSTNETNQPLNAKTLSYKSHR